MADKDEIRAKITRCGEQLSLSYIKRDDEEQYFEGSFMDDGMLYFWNENKNISMVMEEEENGIYVLNGEEVSSAKKVSIILKLESVFKMTENKENYYDVLEISEKEAEQFAMEIKKAAADGEAFSNLCDYPITVNVNGEKQIIDDETEMQDFYVEILVESKAIEKLKGMFTKYNFANFLGVCVEDGICWFGKNGKGDYRITALSIRKENEMDEFAFFDEYSGFLDDVENIEAVLGWEQDDSRNDYDGDGIPDRIYVKNTSGEGSGARVQYSLYFGNGIVLETEAEEGRGIVPHFYGEDTLSVQGDIRPES